MSTLKGGRHWHQDPAFLDQAVSYITNRTIVANTDTTRFHVCPGDIRGGIRDAFNRVTEFWSRLTTKPSPRMRAELGAIESLVDCGQLGQWLEEIWDAKSDWGAIRVENGYRPNDKSRVRHLLTALHAHGVLAWPASNSVFNQAFPLESLDFAPGADQSWVHELNSAFSVRSKKATSVAVTTLASIYRSRYAISEVGDLTPNVIGQQIRSFGEGYARATAIALVAVQRLRYGRDSITHEPNDYGPWGRRAIKSDLLFKWAVEPAHGGDLKMKEWRELATQHISERNTSIAPRRDSIVSFFYYLIEARIFDPGQYFRSDIDQPPYVVPGNDPYTKAQRNNYVFDFLSWCIATRYTEEDDHGRPVTMPGFRNPVARATARSSSRLAESNREAMPTRFVNICIDILTANDWAWAKEAGRTNTGGDYLSWFNPETRCFELVWCPARAYIIYLKLRTPFRTFQVRMMDSGEADTFQFDPATQTMALNKGPLARGDAIEPVQKGVLQLVRDKRSGRDTAVMRLNTNKTADIGLSADQKGFDSPYLADDVARVITDLRSWQSKYNSISKPTDWSEVPEFIKSKSKLQLKDMSACFLFRDAAGSHHSTPIMDGRLKNFWFLLLLELESRLEREGILTPSGEPYRLVGRDKRGMMSGVAFDLHTMRVTQITALYESGVSPEVIQKLVGHRTVVMTLYYTKLGITKISEIVAEAEVKILRGEQRNWAHHRKSLELRELRSAVAHNDDAGLSAFSSNSASIVFMDHGICPVGCARCHSGGPRVNGITQYTHFSSVPGGKSNCAGCRFFISGPPFLHGLVASFNAKSQLLYEKSGRREILRRQLEELELSRTRARESREPFAGFAQWENVSDAFEGITQEVDALALQIHNIARFVDLSQALLEQSNGAVNQTVLVVQDRESIRTVLSESSEWDLADRICQSSVFFESIDCGTANLRRMRHFDVMLRRSGLPPAFLGMSDSMALKVGNELSNLLVKRLGRERTIQLMNGDATLESLGLGAGDRAAMTKILGFPLKIDRPQGIPGLAPKGQIDG